MSQEENNDILGENSEDKRLSGTNDDNFSKLNETDNVEINEILNISGKVRNELSKIIIGQTELIDLLLISLLIKGHILIEGVPGIAKTLTAKLFSKTIGGQFSRIQFTPDLMPSDILGTNVFNSKTQDFDFKAGPIFANVIVIDEINRSPAKTQAALFEVMQEGQVTIDGQTRTIDHGFMVIATQNPIDSEGTYTLPEAQLDRFLFKVIISYPSPQEEIEILHRFAGDFNMREMENVSTVIDLKDFEKLRMAVERVKIGADLIEYIANIIQATRETGDLYLGASTRAALWLMKASKASAALNGRDFVTPDDIRRVTEPVLNHRIILSPQREMEGTSTAQILSQIIESVEVPR